MNQFKTIKISQEVWEAIANRGKFGETEDDVLRRSLDVKSSGPSNPTMRPTQARGNIANLKVWERQATDALRARCTGNKLVFQFDRGPTKEVVLPQHTDKTAIRKIRDESVSWAAQHGATKGQIAFVMKEFTSRGYHVQKSAHQEFLA